MRDAGLARARHQRFTERFDCLGVLAIEQAVWHSACARLARRHQNFDAADREGKRTHARAFEKDAPLHGVHVVLPGEWTREASFIFPGGVNAKGEWESSGPNVSLKHLRLRPDGPQLLQNI